MRQSNEFVVTVGNASTQLLGHNPRRRALIITTDTNAIYVSSVTPAVSGQGIQIPTGIQPTKLCCRDAGTWMTYQLWAIAPAGPTKVWVLEVLADPAGDVEDTNGSY